MTISAELQISLVEEMLVVINSHDKVLIERMSINLYVQTQKICKKPIRKYSVSAICKIWASYHVNYLDFKVVL